jgi:hypothetical protein
VFSQLADFNPNVPTDAGFTFADLKAEIDAGYPVLLYLQQYGQLFRNLPGMPHGNPDMHGMLAYGYYIADSGNAYVRYKTSWGSSGDNTFSFWGPLPWQADLPVRGVIGYHPLPQITSVSRTNGVLTIAWDGPLSILSNVVAQTDTPLHSYVVEQASSLTPPDFQPVSQPTSQSSTAITNCCGDGVMFLRLKLLPAGSAASGP